MKTLNERIPIFYGFDERFSPYAYVAIYSLISNCDKNREYDIHILHTDLTKKTQNIFSKLKKENIHISFDDISEDFKDLKMHLPIRDYYSVSTYFRLIIAEKFPQYDKVIYIDSDTVTLGDISKLYDIDISNYLLAGVPEEVMQLKETGEYAKKVLGINPNRYFNAGVIMINARLWRQEHVLNQFINLSAFYDFTIAQDQDYLNVICKDRVMYLNRIWNTETIHRWKNLEGSINILHYAFCAKPWQDNTVFYADSFWSYAKETPYYMNIKKAFADYTIEQLENAKKAEKKVFMSCLKEIERDDNFMKRLASQNVNDFVFLKAC